MRSISNITSKICKNTTRYSKSTTDHVSIISAYFLYAINYRNIIILKYLDFLCKKIILMTTSSLPLKRQDTLIDTMTLVNLMIRELINFPSPSKFCWNVRSETVTVSMSNNKTSIISSIGRKPPKKAYFICSF
jgi:hypothetical protein